MKRKRWIAAAMVLGTVIYLLLPGCGPPPAVRCEREWARRLDAVAAVSEDYARMALSGEMPVLSMQIYLKIHADRWRAFADAQNGRIREPPPCLSSDHYWMRPATKRAEPKPDINRKEFQ